MHLIQSIRAFGGFSVVRPPSLYRVRSLISGFAQGVSRHFIFFFSKQCCFKTMLFKLFVIQVSTEVQFDSQNRGFSYIDLPLFTLRDTVSPTSLFFTLSEFLIIQVFPKEFSRPSHCFLSRSQLWLFKCSATVEMKVDICSQLLFLFRAHKFIALPGNGSNDKFVFFV